jgi:MFS superfamily sulfate permease-like transporter
VLQDASAAFVLPDFRGLSTATGLQFLLLFTLIGSLESLLSAKAIELLDPWKRKTNFDRDLIAVGVANTIAAMVGGLPMISEIVRSKANIDNGARTSTANACHGLFLLGFVLLFPGLIHSIPLAALGAMLVFTGFRLASPQEFLRTYQVGTEQFIVFLGTVFATLATDLLIGIAVGIGLKVAFHLWNGCPIMGFFKTDVGVVSEGDDRVILVVRTAAIFGNWLGLRNQIETASQGKSQVTIDLSNAKLVDHSVMEKLHELEDVFQERGQTLNVMGLDNHTPLSKHPLAARKLARISEANVSL